MYRLIVADDEKIVIDSVSLIIKKNFSNITFETVRSGREAIEVADNFRPDIILMDIRMPGINGIDAIKEIRSRHENVLIIIISAYEQFEFAKEALKMGVIDYLLKPITKTNLINSIQNAIRTVDEEREKRKKQIEDIEKYQEILPYIEHNVIYSLILGDQFSETIKKYREILSIKNDAGYIMILEFNAKNGIDVFDQNLYAYVRDIIKYKCKCIIGPIMLNRIVVLIPTNNQEEYRQRLESIEIGEYVSNKINDKRNEFELTIGIGSYASFENMMNSYDEALKAINIGKNNDINHIKDIKGNNYITSEYPREQERILKDACVLGKKDDAVIAFEEIYKWIYKNYINSFMEAKRRLFEIMIVIQEYKFDNNLIDIFKINDFSSVEMWCKERIIFICGEVNKVQKKNINKLILSAEKYIDNNYNKEITLEEISSEVCVSPHYFSRLFKEETGKNYIDYLTEKRINKAKELMQSTDLTVKEICYKIGYNDPNYFSRLFKKLEKVTPTDFLKNSEKNKE